jgi:uncharacterized protein
MATSFGATPIQPRLTRLPHRAKIAFLLSCAERLVPNYVVFWKHHGWGDLKSLRQALDLGWRCLGGQTIEPYIVMLCRARCEAATPDTEKFSSKYVSPALDAAVACTLVLDLLLDDDAQTILEGATVARDTVDMYVQEIESLDPSDPEREKKILRHPLMQRELRRQREDLELLERIELSHDAIETLARRWRSPPASNIDLP